MVFVALVEILNKLDAIDIYSTPCTVYSQSKRYILTHVY